MVNERLTAARMRDLARAIEELTVAPTMGALVEIIRRSARRLIGADGISIVLLEDEFCHYVEEDAIGPLWKGQRFLAEVCISGWAMIHQQAAVIPDIDLDDRIPHALYRETFVRSLVMAPIMAGDTAIGALGAYWSEVHQPSDAAAMALETIARFAGLAVVRIDRVEPGTLPSV
jgi:GAF domain-containing protein